MNILVTGGLGLIGSHTCVELIANQHQVVIVDNLLPGSRRSESRLKSRLRTITIIWFQRWCLSMPVLLIA